MLTFKKFAWVLAFLLGSLSFAPVLAQTATAGQLINLNGTVYLVGSNGLYGFPSLAVFNSWGFNFNQLTTATTAESAMTMIGLVPTMQAGCDTPLHQISGNCSGISGSVRVGQLININGTVYYVTSNGLYGFPNATTFYSWNYVFSQIVPANSAEAALPVLGLVPTMQAGCSTPQNQISGNCSGASGGVNVGALINEQGTIYLVGSNGLYGFPDAATFYSWGFNFSQIVPANSAEAALPVLGLVPSKNPGCSSPLTQIASNCAGPIPTPTTVVSNCQSATTSSSQCPAIPFISSLSPSVGPVGSTITINGTGFAPLNNTVNFSVGSFTGIASMSGNSLSFTIPNSVGPSCAGGVACPMYVLQVTPNNYNISVTNPNGTSNSVTFTVTSNCPTNADCSPIITPTPTPTPGVCEYATPPSGCSWQGGSGYPACNAQLVCGTTPVISSLSPSAGPDGSTVTIIGTGFTSTGNKIVFGNTGSQYNPSYSLNSSNGTTITFTVPFFNYYACQNSSPACLPPNAVVPPATYAVSVTNSSGTSNSVNFIVTQNY